MYIYITSQRGVDLKLISTHAYLTTLYQYLVGESLGCNFHEYYM